MKTVFLTGINGLLGTNLASELLNRGFYVKGLIRDRVKYQGPAHENLELIEGELLDNLQPFCTGCDYLVHAAAETRQNLLQYSAYQKINIEAAVHLFQTAMQCGVKKFVFVSTANTLGYGSSERPGTEQEKMKFPFSASFYARSKKEAEAHLQKNTNKPEVVLIHPCFMLGAFDTKPGSGKIILMAWKKKLVFYPPGGKNFVHVRDVTEGIIRSFENGRHGEKYLLAGENLSYFEFFQKLNRTLNQQTLLIKIPRPVLRVLGYWGDLLRFFRLETNLCSVNMEALCINNFYSNEKSVSELGMTYRPVEEAIRDAVSYFKQARSLDNEVREHQVHSKMHGPFI